MPKRSTLRKTTTNSGKSPKPLAKGFAGRGRKRPLLDKPISHLYLDSENPRLPEELQGRREDELLYVLYKEFNLDELADSMAQNGYFDEEPLVAIPRGLPEHLVKALSEDSEYISFIEDADTKFTVVEGNRRLATAKLLVSFDLREKLRVKHWPEVSSEIADDLRILPIIIYPRRDEVVPYLGARHIIGTQRWDAYAKARYIAKWIESGSTLETIAEQMGGKGASIRSSYLSYKLIEQAQDEFDFDAKRAKNNFSLLQLAIGQGSVRRFLGIPSKLSDTDLNAPVSKEYLKNLRDLLRWIFGDGMKQRVIGESRDITNLLSAVVSSPEAVEYLERTGNLVEAYDRTDGEEKMLLKYLSNANRKLEAALGIAYRHKTIEVTGEVEKCESIVKELLKTLRES